MLGERPGRPRNPIFTNGLWLLALRCLEENPRRRPEIPEVIACLRRALVRRKRHTSVAGVVKGHDTTLESTRERLSLYRIYCSGLARRLWRRYKFMISPEPGVPSDESNDKLGESCQNFDHAKVGGLDTNECVQPALSGSPNFV